MPDLSLAPPTGPRAAAAGLLAAHPGLDVASVDTVDVPGGPRVLIQTEDVPALRAWARALGTTARSTGYSMYGTARPDQSGVPDWLWWRLVYLDTTVDQVAVRLWTLEASAHPRGLAAYLAATVPCRT